MRFYLFTLTAAIALAAISSTNASAQSLAEDTEENPGNKPVVVTATAATTPELSTGAAQTMADSISSVKPSLKMEADSLLHCYETVQQDAGANKEYVYRILNECVQRNIDYLQSSEITPNDYVEVKDRLRLLHPQLQIAGIYYSQQNNHVMGVSLLEKYINIPWLDAFKNERITMSEYYPSLLYYVASNKYNTQKFDEAIVYLKAYLDTHELKNERMVLIFLSKSYGYTLDSENQILTLMRGVQKYPTDQQMLHDIIKYHIRARNAAQAELYLPAFEATKPKPIDLYELRAGIAEAKGDYFTSLKISEALYDTNRDNYDYIKMLARSSYNYVIMEMDKGRVTSTGAPDPSLVPYLENAARLFVIVNNQKPEKQYLDGLIDTYLLLGRRDEAMQVAQRIGRQIDAMQSSKKVLAEQTTVQQGSRVTSNGIPVFSVFLQSYLDDKLRAWMQKGQFEKKADYEERTTGEGLEAKKRELVQNAKESYIRHYGAVLNVGNFIIGGYDADHEIYLIHYNRGDMLVRVPLEGDQAQKFQEDWNHGRVSASYPKYDISGDSLVLAGLTFVSQSGMSYKYDITENLQYENVDVKVTNPISVLNNDLLAGIETKKAKQTIGSSTIDIGDDNKMSDIDIDIPTDSIENPYTFALVISNENYTFADKVNYALSDGRSFVDYCQKTLGIPKKNITQISDASYLEMQGKINYFCELMREYADKARVIVYYSGHGVPNLETQEAYLLAVDGSPLTMSGSILIDNFYESLSATGVQSINVFLDCCFSGASKSGNMLVEARGTVIKPKASVPRENMVVMTACTGDQIAFPYTDQHHGMFTYFLLKKLKESKGEVQLGELFQYVQSNVRRQSLHDKKRKQEPSVEYDMSLMGTWGVLKLK